MVTIRYGVNSLTSENVAGQTVRDVRAIVEDVMNVPESAEARVNGAAAQADSEISDGVTVEFVKVAGEKGA